MIKQTLDKIHRYYSEPQDTLIADKNEDKYESLNFGLCKSRLN